MKKLRLGEGFVVFVIFFGIAVLDAIRSFDWLGIVFWLGAGALFILADNLRKPKEN